MSVLLVIHLEALKLKYKTVIEFLSVMEKTKYEKHPNSTHKAFLPIFHYFDFFVTVYTFVSFSYLVYYKLSLLLRSKNVHQCIFLHSV